MNRIRVVLLIVLCLASFVVSACGASLTVQYGVEGVNHFSPDKAIGDHSEGVTGLVTVGNSENITNPSLVVQDTAVGGNAAATAGIGHLHAVANFDVVGRTFVGPDQNGNDTLYSG